MPMPSVNPFLVVGGAVAGPVAASALSHKFFGPDTAVVKDQATADAEMHKSVRNTAILNALAAAGMAYGGYRTKNEKLRSLLIGGAIGTALTAGTLGSVLVVSPTAAEQLPPPKAALPIAANVPGWVSNVLGF